jgi:hypothetical protein
MKRVSLEEKIDLFYSVVVVSSSLIVSDVLVRRSVSLSTSNMRRDLDETLLSSLIGGLSLLFGNRVESFLFLRLVLRGLLPLKNVSKS